MITTRRIDTSGMLGGFSSYDCAPQGRRQELHSRARTPRVAGSDCRPSIAQPLHQLLVLRRVAAEHAHATRYEHSNGNTVAVEDTIAAHRGNPLRFRRHNAHQIEWIARRDAVQRTRV